MISRNELMFFHFVKYKLDTIKLKTKLFAGSKRGTLFAAFLRAVSYMAIQGEIPMINSFNLFRREADTSFGWNLILVNDDYCVPRNYEVELTELSNGEKVDSRIYPQLQQMFDDARAEGLELFVREGYRTTQDQKDIMNERIQQYQDEGYSRGEAKKLAKEYVAEPGTSEHELGIAVDINADTSKCSSDAVYTWLANNAYKYGRLMVIFT